MSYYNKLKYLLDLPHIAQELGFNGSRAGSVFQGDCPAHGSSGGCCLTIYPRTQSWYCFHCNKGGDVIDLVRHFSGWDFDTAANYLADKAGMPHRNTTDCTPEEQALRDAEYSERSLVQDMLTEAQAFYCKQLDHYSDIKEHLLQDRRFSEDIINEWRTGYSPHDNDTALYQHLESFERFRGKSQLTGLFIKHHGGYHDYFSGRIVYPHWKNGKVVYMGGRATAHTIANQYECYTKGGIIKLDDDGNPVYIKYKKLRTHDPNDASRRDISPFIQNDTFVGEDSIRGAKDVIITEGYADCISAIDHGFAAIAPATVKFREQDYEKLKQLTRHADNIYLVNDSEENDAGKQGALATGKYLAGAGKNVFIVELPRPVGMQKVDLNEYLRDHTAEDLRALMDGAKPVIEIIIGGLPKDFIKALPVMQGDLFPLLAEMKAGTYEYFLDKTAKHVKAKKAVLETELEAFRKKSQAEPKKAVDPAIEAAAHALLQNPSIFKHRLDVINQAGVVGERQVVAMYFVVMDSRLLKAGLQGTHTLAMKNSGHYGSGKSFVIMICLQLYPDSGYHFITNGSAKSLYYLPNGLKHKALIVAEGFQYETRNSQDSELVYCTRTLISEGCIRYQVAEKQDSGNIVTVERKLDGPTAFITTTFMDKLEAQLEDRLSTVHPDESAEQTSAIILATGEQAAGDIPALDEKTIAMWKRAHELLEPINVVIPYAKAIAIHVVEKKMPIATRRAFKRVLSVIRAVACLHQYQRDKDKNGSVIADVADYRIALQLVLESFRESLGSKTGRDAQRLEELQKQGRPMTPKELSKLWGVSGSAVSQWVTRMVKENTLLWCDDNGREFDDDRDLKKAKSGGRAYLKLSDACVESETLGLPTPYDLTGDREWNAGGTLYQMFDLELGSRIQTTETSEKHCADNAEQTEPLEPVEDAQQEDNDLLEDETEDDGFPGTICEEVEDSSNNYIDPCKWADSPYIDDKERARRKRLAKEGSIMF